MRVPLTIEVISASIYEIDRASQMMKWLSTANTIVHNIMLSVKRAMKDAGPFIKRSANASDNIRKSGGKVKNDTTKSKQINSRTVF